ncbi:MAG: hypothetical protein ACYC46_06040 [Acidobacteriaceae bacterium]
MSYLADDFARLNARIEALENRVSALESPSTPPRLVQPQTDTLGVTQSERMLPFAQAGGGFSVVGKAMLGIAGAYLLRAVAEAGTFPMLAVVVLAFAYAGVWLVWATRVVEWEWFAATAYATTSALILAPMLWELTLRFRVLPTAVTAGVLCVFVIATSVRAWKRNLASIFWVVSVTAILLSLSLMIATRDMMPFVWALLLMALLCEYAVSRNHWLSSRPLVAMAADAAVWALIFIYSSPETAMSSNYKVVPPALVLAAGAILFLIYGVSTLVRSTLLRRSISVFEIGQTTATFLLLALDVHEVGTGGSATIFAIACLLLSLAGYVAVFMYFDGFPEHRNYHVYATWSAALLLAGSLLALSSLWLTLCLGIAALVLTFTGIRLLRLTPQFHAFMYLVVATFVSGFMQFAAQALAGTYPAPVHWIAWLAPAAAIVCYALAGRSQEGTWGSQLLRLLFAILAVSILTTLLITALVRIMAFGVTPDAPHIAVIRTFATCAMALALAFGGSRWRRIELVWIAYGTLVFVALKLLFEDMRQGHPAFIAASIFLYAIALLLVPRLVRLGQKT